MAVRGAITLREQNGKNKERRKSKKKKSRKVLRDWVRLLGMPVPKNVTKRDATVKKGMLSCLILSS